MTQRIDPHLWQRHAWMNRLQTAVLVVVLATLLATVGWLLWGNDGILYMLVFCAVSLVLQPLAGPELVLRLYRAQPIARSAAPELHALVERLAARGACAMPRLVTGSRANLKITWPEDLALAEAILAAQAEAKGSR